MARHNTGNPKATLLLLVKTTLADCGSVEPYLIARACSCKLSLIAADYEGRYTCRQLLANCESCVRKKRVGNDQQSDPQAAPSLAVSFEPCSTVPVLNIRSMAEVVVIPGT